MTSDKADQALDDLLARFDTAAEAHAKSSAVTRELGGQLRDVKQTIAEADAELVKLAPAPNEAAPVSWWRSILYAPADNARPAVEPTREHAAQARQLNRNKDDLSVKLDVLTEELRAAKDKEDGDARDVSEITKDIHDVLRAHLSQIDALSRDAFNAIHRSETAASSGAAALRLAPEELDPKDNRLEAVTGVTLASRGLEEHIHAITEHLTHKRIVEEMDAATYVSRARTFFDRAKLRSQELRADGGPLTTALRTLDSLESDIGDIQEQCKNKLQKLEAHNLSTKELRLEFAKLDQIIENTKVVRAVVDGFFVDRLKRFEIEACGESYQEQLSDRLNKVSTEIESTYGLFRWKAFIFAVVGALLTKVILSSGIIFVNNIYFLLTTVFATIYGVVLYLSIKKDENEKVFLIHESVLSGISKILNGKDWRGGSHEFFKFREVKLDEKFADSAHGHMGAPRSGNRFWRYARLAAAPALTPAAFLIAAYVAKGEVFWPWNPPTDNHYRLVGVTPTGERCEYDRGVIVNADATHYHVLSSAGRTNHSALVRSTFPELIADAVRRDEIVRVDVDPQGEHSNLGACNADGADIADLPETREVAMASMTNNYYFNRNQAGGGAPDVLGASDVLGAIGKVRAVTDALPELISAQTGALTKLHGLLEARPEAPPAQSVVVIPNIVTPSPAPPSAPKVEFHGDLTTVIHVDGARHEHHNAVLTPFAPRAIPASDHDPARVFAVGAAARGGAAGGDYIDQLAQHLIARLKAAGDEETVTVDVMGFASRSWRSVDELPELQGGQHAAAREELKGRLNHALGEGRRVAILSALRDAFLRRQEGALLQRVAIGEVQPSTCLSEWSPPSDFAANQNRFEAFEPMEHRMKTWVETDSDALYELLARSVVVQLSAGAEAMCDA